jgi:cobalt-zinc-cadmium efflux system outer membrane protein
MSTANTAILKLKKPNFHGCLRRGLQPLIHPAAGAIFGALILTGCATYHSQPISPSQTADSFARRSLSDEHLRAFLVTNHVAAPGNGDAWNLPALTLTAFYYQPSLAEARAPFAVAQSAQITAGQRPNPSVTVTPGYDSGIPDNPSPWLVSLTTDWPIETAGKRGKRIAQARSLTEAARWNLVGAIWQARSHVRAALVALYAARETEAYLTRQTLAQSNVVRLLEGQLAAGNISGYEVTQARVALDTARLQSQDAAGQYGQARAQMAVALGVPLQALDGVKFSFAGLADFPKELARPEVRRLALLNRSDVRAALAEYAASQRALQLEIAKQYPDVNLGPGYAWNAGSAGDNQWSLGVTVTLPILNHNEGPVAEAKARRAQAAAHFLAVQANAIGEIDSALAAYDAALRQSATAKALLDNLRRQLNSVRAREKAGAAEPLTVANAEVEFDATAQNQLAAALKAAQSLGQLEDSVQSPLTLPPAALQAAEKASPGQ